MSAITEALHQVISIYSILIFSIFTIGIALYSALRFHLRISPINKEIDNSIKEIQKSERDKLSFPSYFYEFSEWMAGCRYLNDSWREFEETLLTPGDDFEGSREIILNTHLTNTYFNQKNILWHHIDMRFYNTLPNILTGLGIIGTFIGLSVGIYLAAPGLNSNDMNDAKEALNTLLDGAALAFITSIAGLVSSLLFSFYEKKRIHNFTKRCQTLVAEIDARLEYFSAERLANKALEESKKQSIALESFANDLAVSLGQVIEQQVATPLVNAINELKNEQKSANDETVEKLMREFSESISGAAGEEMKAFASTIEIMTEKMEEQVSSLSSGQMEMQAASKKAVEDMSTALSQGSVDIAKGIADAVSDLSSGMSEAIRSVTVELENAAKKMAEDLSNALANVSDIVDKLKSSSQQMHSLSESNEQLHSQLNETLTQSRELIESATQANIDFKTISSEFAEYGKAVKKHTDALAKSTTNTESYVAKLIESQLGIEKTWKEYQERFADVDKSVEQLFNSINQGLQTYAQKTDEYVLGLDKHASEVVQSLAGATQDISESVENLDETLEQRAVVFTKGLQDIAIAMQKSTKSSIESAMKAELQLTEKISEANNQLSSNGTSNGS